MGEIKKSESILQDSLAIASKLSLVTEEVKTLLALGNTLVAYGNPEDRSYYKAASTQYQKAIALCESIPHCSHSDLPLQINLAQLNLLLKTESEHEGIKLIKSIQQQFSQLPLNQNLVDWKISFAHDLVILRQKKANNPTLLAKIPSWSAITALVDTIITEAQKLNYSKAESYGWGIQGNIQEILGQWEQAYDCTTKALNLAQNLNAPEISYLWLWQLGRIERVRGNRQNAIAHYRQGITLLNTLSQDLAHLNSNLQYSFRDNVEPIYRETVALLLDTSTGKTVTQENLIQARDTMESLQLAELQNFFRQACSQAKSVAIDSLDSHAAALYPIILSDRLVLILSLPHQPLQYYSVPISQAKLEATIEQLQKTIVIRSRRDFYQPASQLYDWLITPAIAKLQAHQIETIIFIPDGALRNVPLAALYNGKNYLIEQYNLVLNPGLQLLNPRPLKHSKLKALAVGLTQEKENFTALEYVNLELAKIQEQVKSLILLNEEFTVEAFQEKIKFSDYPIIHIATHGQFSSSLQDTFLLTWDRRIDLDLLNQILQVRTKSPEKAIELLILSACETATGDKWAALGLAGIAIKAGARSTIATLWSINDRATAQLMNNLYETITTQSIGKAEALRQAQLSILQDSQYEHPFYWAAYTIIGNWL
jgi:CHAT domain-containing protein